MVVDTAARERPLDQAARDEGNAAATIESNAPCDRPGRCAGRQYHRLSPMLRVFRIDELTAQQCERRVAIDNRIVEWIGDDFRHPHKSRLYAAQIEEMQGTEQQRADTEHQPHERNVAHIFFEVVMRLEEAEE